MALVLNVRHLGVGCQLFWALKLANVSIMEYPRAMMSLV
jgi:hypothetical protein